jgi:hypothetical protein
MINEKILNEMLNELINVDFLYYGTFDEDDM